MSSNEEKTSSRTSKQMMDENEGSKKFGDGIAVKMDEIRQAKSESMSNKRYVVDICIVIKVDSVRLSSNKIFSRGSNGQRSLIYLLFIR